MDKPKGKLGIDYAEVTLGDFPEILGCYAEDKNAVHLGQLFSRVTACGKPIGDTLMTKHFYITCKECVAELVYRNSHPSASKKPFGIVTNKKGV